VILTGQEILAQREVGRIQIDPFSSDQINPNSYDFRLGGTLKWYKNTLLDVKEKQEVETVEIPIGGTVISPEKIYLGHTLEVMGSDHFVPIIRGRSSSARIGLFIHVTADLIDIGSHNQWTLQLHAVQPLRLFRGMLIGQVTFWTVEGEITLYTGKYQGTSGPQESEIYRDFQEGS
jgi:dCTP deaminase